METNFSFESFPLQELESMVAHVFIDPIDHIEVLPPSASTRRYFRIQTKHQTQSMIVMFAPDGAKPEEASITTEASEWPFVQMQRCLLEQGIRVPKIFAERCSAGLLLLEDLGDQTLAVALKKNPTQQRELYTQAIHLLVRMHNAMNRLLGEATKPKPFFATRCFDYASLRWELDHFIEYGLDARQVSFTETIREKLKSNFDQLATQLTRMPQGFVHRDYQSRNLMLDPQKNEVDALVVIDFQDALLGPRMYDLVALLYDSYQELDPNFIDEMIRLYCSQNMLSYENARVEFDILGVQRKLKDAGRFIFLDREKHNPSFLPFFKPSLERVQSSLMRLRHEPLFANIHHLLREVLPDYFS